MSTEPRALPDRLKLALEGTGAKPWRIRPGGKSVIVWEIGPDSIWREIATFARKEDAEAFVFVLSDPVLGQWS
jgi:hypothetical protein